MTRWRGLAANLCGWVSAAFLAAMMLLTVADVVLRKVGNNPIHGTFELVELLLVCTFFFALPATFLRDENIVVDMIDGWRPRWVPLLKRLSSVLAAVMLATIAWQSWLQARDAMSFGDVTSDLSLPRILYWAPLVFGIAGGALAAVAMAFEAQPRRMSAALIGIIGVAALLAALLVRVPIGLALATTGFLGYAAIDGWSKALKMLGSVPFNLATAYSLSVIPLFILMGAVASRAAMSRELFDAANALFSGFRGALTHATIGACAAFGAICGSSIATAATFSKVSIPEMRRHGYDPGFAAGAVASAGHARHHHPAVGDPRDLLDRRRAVAAEALRGGVHSRRDPRRAVRDHGGDRRAPAPRADAAHRVDAARRAAARRDRHVEARAPLPPRGGRASTSAGTRRPRRRR